jgi:LPXTG-motif cell wall-anchored protein
VLSPLAAPAAANTINNCTATAGTIIAVDFAHWGGPVVRGCDTGNPKNGAYLLTDEGFTLAGDKHDGPAFICRIGNQAFNNGTQYPTPSEDPCIVTPPASAYWSYWLAPAGQNTWTYSPLGAYSDLPKPGEIELWIFGGTNIAGTEGRPTCTPNSLRAGGSGGRCTPATGAVPGPTGKGPGSGAPTLDPSAAAAMASARAQAEIQSREQSQAHPDTSTSSAPAGCGGLVVGSPSPGSAAPCATVASSAGPGTLVDADTTVHVQTSAGSIVPVVIGLGLAAVLAAGGGFIVWRRRRMPG